MSHRNEADEWNSTVPTIGTPEQLAAIRAVLEQSPIILEHWFYRGACAPDCLVFDDYEAFEVYLRDRARPGDAIYVWRYDTLCRNDNVLARGKVPDADGLAPKKGAY